MGNVIQTNVSSINAQRALGKTNTALQTTFQRLSTGLRINSARDDAAGLQISDRLTSQIGGLTQASRNANDGISVAQTAEGALQESTTILQRIRDLAIQSANGSNSDDDRTALQAEVTQLQVELNRIATTTSFGTTSLLDGSFGANFQVGANNFETIGVSLGSFKTDTLGTTADQAAEGVLDAAFDGAITVTSSGNQFNLAFADTVNGTAVNAELIVTDGTYTSADAFVSELNVQIGLSSDLAGRVSAAVDDNGGIVLRSITGGAGVSVTVAAGAANDALAAVTDIAAVVATGVDAASATADSAISSVDIGTAYGAQNSLLRLDAAISEIDSARGDLGAAQNRLGSTLSNLGSIIENVSAARSRIRDTDFASETANLAKNQVLQQAGLSILAQANASSQSVLSLLQ